jgi:hypothetical protein
MYADVCTSGGRALIHKPGRSIFIFSTFDSDTRGHREEPRARPDIGCGDAKPRVPKNPAYAASFTTGTCAEVPGTRTRMK